MIKAERESWRKTAEERKRERDFSQHRGDLTRILRSFQITVVTYSNTCDQHEQSPLKCPIMPIQNKCCGQFPPHQLAFNRFSTPPAFNRFSKRKSCALFSHRPSIDVEHASATYFFLITYSGGERPVYTDWATASDAVWQRASDRDLSQASFHAAFQRGLSVVQSQKTCLFRRMLCSDGCRCLPWEVDLWRQVGLHSPS